MIRLLRGGDDVPLAYPDFYKDSKETRQFLLDVEGRIHRLVRATIPLASPPKLHVVPWEPMA